MTINIGGEILTLDVLFSEQNTVRDAENAVKKLYLDLQKKWPKVSERKLLAMVTYQFSYWYQELVKRQNEAVEAVERCENAINSAFNNYADNVRLIHGNA